MNKNYEVLSKFYDKIIYDSNYDNWTSYIVSLLKKYTSGKTGFDCCSGSGIVTEKIKKEGYNVTGIDISEEMLAVAEQNAIKMHLNIPYMKQDVVTLKSFEKLSFITCINDGINYVTKENLKKCFTSFKKCLKKGGILIFDYSSEYKLKNVLANNVFCDNSEDVSYIWFNTLNENSVDFTLTFFEKQENGYKRYDETQTEYIHTESEIDGILKELNFTVLEKTNANGGKIEENTDRILYVCKLN